MKPPQQAGARPRSRWWGSPAGEAGRGSGAGGAFAVTSGGGITGCGMTGGGGARKGKAPAMPETWIGPVGPDSSHGSSAGSSGPPVLGALMKGRCGSIWPARAPRSARSARIRCVLPSSGAWLPHWRSTSDHESGRPAILDQHVDLALVEPVLERHLAAPRERAERSVGVDPERVAGEAHFRQLLAWTRDERPRMDPREGRGEAGVLRAQVLEHDGGGAGEGIDLLVGRRRVEERRIEIFRQGLGVEGAAQPALGVTAELANARRPPRRDGPESGGRDPVAPPRDRSAARLEVREGLGPVGAHPHGVVGVRPAGGALVAQWHADEGLPLAHAAVRRKGALAEDLD